MVIARQSVGGRLVLAVDDLLEPLLRAPRVPGVIIHIGDVVARLVAVDILPDQPGDVLGMAVVELGVVELEHCVELLDRRVIAPSGRKQIGRASCRERVWQYVWISVVDGALKKKKIRHKKKQ